MGVEVSCWWFGRGQENCTFWDYIAATDRFLHSARADGHAGFGVQGLVEGSLGFGLYTHMYIYIYILCIRILFLRMYTGTTCSVFLTAESSLAYEMKGLFLKNGLRDSNFRGPGFGSSGIMVQAAGCRIWGYDT